MRAGSHGCRGGTAKASPTFPLLQLLAVVVVASTVGTTCAQSTVWNRSFATTVPTSTSFGDPHLYRSTPNNNSLSGGRWTVVVMITNGRASHISSQTAITAMDEASGAVVWSVTPSQTFPTPPYSGWCDSMSIADASSTTSAHVDGASTTTVLFCGLDDGVVAINGTNGAILWRFRSSEGPNPVTPSHPTAVPSTMGGTSDGFVVFTFENGVNSSSMHVLCAKTGVELHRTDGERVFTKIWRIAAIPNAIALCSINATNNIQVSARQLSANASRTLWSHDSLPYSPPGLWDNPNLDVDARGETIFMYEKAAIGLRTVKQFDSKTGALKWQLTTDGHVVDYDTYAYDNNFMRLVTNETSGLLMVESFNTSSPPHDASPMWATTIPCEDPNAILLVGGATPVPLMWVPPRILVFGLNTGTLWNLEPQTGRLLWTMDDLVNISTGIIGHSGHTLLFGTGSTAAFTSLLLSQ